MNHITGAFRAVGAAFTGLAKTTVRTLSLVPPFLAHSLWLISQKFLDLSREGYGGNTAVYACLRLLSSSVPEPPLVPYLQLPDGEPGDPLNFKHPLRQLIRCPNLFMTEYQFWRLVTLHLGIAGHSEWFKERNNAGAIIALWPLRPDRVGPIYSGPEDTADPVLLGWSYLTPGTTQYIAIPRRDIMSFTFPDPAGQSGGLVEGLGPLQVLAAEVSADNEATKFVGNLVSNYAMPGIVLQIKGQITSVEDAQAIKDAFIRDFGNARRGVPGVVDADTTIEQVGFNLQQLEFPALRNISESRIAAAYGVPAVLVGLLVGLNAAIKATTDQLRAFFAETTLASYWRDYSDIYTRDVAAEFGSNIICLFDLTKVRAMAGQAAIEIAQAASAYQMGAITKNEYRQVIGFEDREDGDVYAYGMGPGRGMETEVPADPNAPAPIEDPTTGAPANSLPPKNAPPAPGGTDTAAASNGKVRSVRSLDEPATASDIAEGTEELTSAFAELMADIFREPAGVS